MSDAYSSDQLGRVKQTPHGQAFRIGLILVIVKIIKCIGMFESYEILKVMSLLQFLLFVKMASACALLAIHKPFSSGRSLKRSLWVKVIQHASLRLLCDFGWLFCLTLCGPLRTILIYEHSEPILIAMFMGIFSRANHARTRGSILFFLGIGCLLLFDNDDIVLSSQAHPEGKHTNIVSHLIFSFTAMIGVADHKKGIILLVVLLLLKVAHQGFSKRLSSQLGGPKKLNAMSTFASAAILIPVSLIAALRGYLFVNYMSYIVPLVVVTLTVFLIDYYSQSFVASKIEGLQSHKFGYVTIALFAILLGFQWNHPAAMVISKLNSNTSRTEEHIVSGGVIISAIFFILASDILSWPDQKSRKGKFVGYSSEGNPLYCFAGDALNRASTSSFAKLIKGFLKQILEKKDSRHIFYFFCLNLCFAFVELCWGIWSNSLGLVSDSFHMMFDSTALVLGLVAAVMARWKPTKLFPYGYGRIEVLSGFINALFLLTISLSLMYQAFQRLIEPPEIDSEQLLIVSVGGFAVNLIGAYLFSHTHNHPHEPQIHHSHGHHHHHHDHDSENANMKGLYLHILADLLGSIGVIMSSLLIDKWQLYIADPICTLIVAALILSSLLPLLFSSARILTLRLSTETDRNMRDLLNKISIIEGVTSIHSCRIWQHGGSELVAAINITVLDHIEEQEIIKQASVIFQKYGVHSSTVQVEKDTFYQHMSMSGRLSGAPGQHLTPASNSSTISSYSKDFAKLV